MNFPKLVIASDGVSTAALLDGVFIGRGVERIAFSAEGSKSKINVLGLDVGSVSLKEGAEEFTEWCNALARIRELTNKELQGNKEAVSAATDTAL